MFTTTENHINMPNIPYKEIILLSSLQKAKCLAIIQSIIAAIKAKHT